jgi:hypothetical protein
MRMITRIMWCSPIGISSVICAKILGVANLGRYAKNKILLQKNASKKIGTKRHLYLKWYLSRYLPITRRITSTLCAAIRLVTVTLSDVNDVWCYVLSQQRLHCKVKNMLDSVFTVWWISWDSSFSLSAQEFSSTSSPFYRSFVFLHRHF